MQRHLLSGSARALRLRSAPRLSHSLPLALRAASTSSSSSSSSSSSAPASASSTAPPPRKALPSAKAKAQASASRALRAQLASAPQPQQAPVAQQEALAAVSAAPELQQACAYTTAEAYDLDVLREQLERRGMRPCMLDDEVLHLRWPPLPSCDAAAAADAAIPPTAQAQQQGDVLILRSGSYVTWGLAPEQSRRVLRAVIRTRRRGAGAGGAVEAPVEREPFGEVGDEGMEYVAQSDSATRIIGDLLILGDAPPVLPNNRNPTGDHWSPLSAKLAFSQGLARSARLSVQESALDVFLEQCAPLPRLLETEGKVPLPRKQVVRRMGTLLRLRQRANLSRDNFFDEPEVYWENEYLAHHYDSICATLDIESRFRALNEKLDHCENLLGVLRALLTEASSHRMELIIIYLIAFETLVALISHDYVPSPIRAYNELMALLGRPHLRLQARGGGAAHEEKEQSTRQAERVSGSSMAHQLRESSSAASHARLV